MKLSDEAIAKLLDLISVQKKYQPGDQLPNEQGLAAELGVSRSTVRTAVQYLLGQGVLEIHRGVGTFVSANKKIDDEFQFNKLNFLHLKLQDVYELRLVLEPQMAYYAALRGTDEEIEHILEMGQRIQQSSELQLEDAEGNTLFHDAIVNACHSEFCTMLMGILSRALMKLIRENEANRVMYPGTDQDHQLLLYYIKARDPEGARLAMELHIKHAMRSYGVPFR
ncbi:MAG: FCD domain-containing protein [Oscillospiraceae bacterium]